MATATAPARAAAAWRGEKEGGSSRGGGLGDCNGTDKGSTLRIAPHARRFPPTSTLPPRVHALPDGTPSPPHPHPGLYILISPIKSKPGPCVHTPSPSPSIPTHSPISFRPPLHARSYRSHPAEERRLHGLLHDGHTTISPCTHRGNPAKERLLQWLLHNGSGGGGCGTGGGEGLGGKGGQRGAAGGTQGGATAQA